MARTVLTYGKLGTNYIPAPSLEIGSGLASYWGLGYSTASIPTATQPAAIGSGSKCQRLQYTGVAADAGESFYFQPRTVAGSSFHGVGEFAEGDPATFAVKAKGSKAGITAQLRIYAYSEAGANLGSVTGADMAISGAVQTFSVTYASLPANTHKVLLYVYFIGISNGDSLDIYIDDAILTKTAAAVDYFDGDTLGYHWTDGAHASVTEGGKNLNDGVSWFLLPGFDPGEKAKSFDEVRGLDGDVVQLNVSEAGLITMIVPLRVQGDSMADLASKIDVLNALIDAGAQTLVAGPPGATTAYACVHSPRVGFVRDELAQVGEAAHVTFNPLRTP